MISNETVMDTETTISLPPGTILGYRGNGMPIYNIAGGASDAVSAGNDADDDDDDASASDDSDDDSDDSDEDDFVPPSREQWEQLLAAKRKSDSESAARKRFLRDNGIDPKTGKPNKQKVVLDDLDDDDDDDDDTDVAAQAKAALDAAKGVSRAKQEKTFQRQLEREVAKTERRVRDQSAVLIAAVPTALQEEGWNGKNLQRILKLMDLDNVSVDEDGEVDGLFEEIEELKKDFPEFFKRTRMKDAAKDIPDAKAVGGGKKTAAPAQKDQSWVDQLKGSIYGNG